MTEKTLTTENIKPAIDALRGELAPWPVVAMKQDRLNDTQKSAVNSGITSSLVAQIIANTAAIRALESAITGTGLRPLVVASLPAIGTQGILYIVPVTTYDPETDADVVNYSNEYIWIVAPDAPVTEGYYEQVGQTGIVINNGQLTITVNGTSVGTFTANQSGNTTAAITVPTNADYVDKTTAQTAAGVKTFSDGIVSNVTGNVTGNLTGTASKAIADEDGTSIKTGYGKLAGSQTWTGVNTKTNHSNYVFTDYNRGLNTTSYFLRLADIYDSNNVRVALWNIEINDDKSSDFKIYTYNTTVTTGNAIDAFEIGCDAQGSAYTKINGKLKSNLVPLANSTYSLGTSSYQWASVYAQTYYYNGTAWGLDKYNQWTGVNDFNNLIGLNNAELWFKHPNIEDITTNPSTDTGKSILQIWNKGTTQYFGGIIDRLATDGSHILELVCFGYPLNDTTPYQHRFRFAAHRNGGADFYPTYNGVVNLGTSSNKWRSLNGINPGALSFPNFDAGITLDTTNWDKTGEYGAGANFWTPTVNGWLTVLVIGTPGSGWVQLSQADSLGQFSVCLSTGYAWATIPVVANASCKICLLCSTVVFAKFYPCLGNV